MNFRQMNLNLQSNLQTAARRAFRPLAAGLSSLAILVSSAALAFAVEAKPVAVISVASVKKLQDSVKYLAASAGEEDSGKGAAGILRIYTQGIDPEKPIGVVLVPHDGDIEEVIFLPVKNLNALLAILQPQIGDPLSTEGGIYEFDDGQKLFVKEQEGWAFAVRQKALLTDLPKDPSAWLGDLPATYTIAARIMVQNIPADVRASGLDEIKFALERGLELLGDVSPEIDPQNAAKTGRGLVSSLEKQINETDDIVVGLLIDPTTKKFTLEVKQQAVEGSDLAKQYALASDSKTNFAGFAMPEAAVFGNFSNKMSEGDIKQLQITLDAARKELLSKIENDPVITPERREGAKKFATRLFDLLDENAKEGKIDGGFSVVLEPKSFSMVAGAYFSKGKEFEKLLIDLATAAQGEPDLPVIKANVSSYAGVNFHTVSQAVPADWAEAREVIGESAVWTVGTSEKALYVAFGRNGESLLKQVIDSSANSADKLIAPSRITVSVLPILKFLASIEERPFMAEIVAATEQGAGDKISFSEEAIPRGVSQKIVIEEGVLKPIGIAIKKAIGLFFGNEFDEGAL